MKTIIAGILVAATAGCAVPVAPLSPEIQARLEAGREWSAPERHTDPMTGLSGWWIGSPTLKDDGHEIQGALIGIGCTAADGPQSEASKLFTATTRGMIAAAIMLPSMEWFDWGSGKQVEMGLWEHDVLIQWDGDPTTARHLSLLGPYGAPSSVRGDETEQFVTELATRRTLRIRVDETYEIPLDGAREQIAALVKRCMDG